MFFIKLVGIFIVVVILGVLLDKLLRKSLKIETPKGRIYEHVNTFHKWGERLVITLFLIIVAYASFSREPIIEIKYIFFIFYLVLYSFRAWMEWKYTKNEKEYIITIYSIGLFLFSLY